MSADIEALFSQLTFKYVQSSMFMLLKDCYSLTSDSNKDLIYPIAEKMDEITKKILTYTFELPATITDDEQISLGRDLTTLRGQVSEIAREVYACSKTASMASSICIAGSSSADEPMRSIDADDYIFELFSKYINVAKPEPIANVDEGLEKALNIGTLLSFLPIKMTKEKYFDYIRKALKSLFNDMSCKSINDIVPLLKHNFFYDEAKITYFPQAWHDVLELVNRTEKIETLDEGDQLLSDIEIFQEWVSQVMVLLDLQHESLNFLSLIRLISSDFSIFFEENILYKDIYYAVKESLLGGDRTLFEENALSSLEDYSEACVDQIRSLETSLEKKLSKMKSIDDNAEHLSQTLLTIQNIYYSSIRSSIYYLNTSTKGESEDNSACINEAISSILDYIKAKLSPFPVKQQRFLREVFFDVIPSPFSIDEFFEYTLLSLNTCSSSRQANALALLSEHFSRINLNMLHEHDNQCNHEHEHGHEHHHCDCEHHH